MATILVVEDEPDLRASVAEALDLLGYQVLTAGDGAEALELFAQHSSEIDLVLSDLVMPKMSGIALFQALVALDPQVKMVIMTGYPLAKQERDFLARQQVGWLQKPYGVADLDEWVRSVIETVADSGDST